jgi:hypothetical protein
MGETPRQTGNSESIIRKHYLDLNISAEADTFCGILYSWHGLTDLATATPSGHVAPAIAVAIKDIFNPVEPNPNGRERRLILPLPRSANKKATSVRGLELGCHNVSRTDLRQEVVSTRAVKKTGFQAEFFQSSFRPLDFENMGLSRSQLASPPPRKRSLTHIYAFNPTMGCSRSEVAASINDRPKRS